MFFSSSTASLMLLGLCFYPFGLKAETLAHFCDERCQPGWSSLVAGMSSAAAFLCPILASLVSNPIYDVNPWEAYLLLWTKSNALCPYLYISLLLSSLLCRISLRITFVIVYIEKEIHSSRSSLRKKEKKDFRAKTSGADAASYSFDPGQTDRRSREWLLERKLQLPTFWSFQE